MQEYMTQFDKYIQDVCDYIEERMNVKVQHEWWNDRICVSFMGMADRYYTTFNNISNEYAQCSWRDRPVGAIAQQIMRVIKEEWMALLMRKESV